MEEEKACAENESSRWKEQSWRGSATVRGESGPGMAPGHHSRSAQAAWHAHQEGNTHSAELCGRIRFLTAPQSSAWAERLWAKWP